MLHMYKFDHQVLQTRVPIALQLLANYIQGVQYVITPSRHDYHPVKRSVNGCFSCSCMRFQSVWNEFLSSQSQISFVSHCAIHIILFVKIIWIIYALHIYKCYNHLLQIRHSFVLSKIHCFSFLKLSLIKLAISYSYINMSN